MAYPDHVRNYSLIYTMKKQAYTYQYINYINYILQVYIKYCTETEMNASIYKYILYPTSIYIMRDKILASIS